MDLTPISRKRLSESAINQIKDFIIQNGLGPGAKLPSERDLCNRLQISRASLREAIRILEIMGLVEVLPGKGIYVKDLTGDLFVPLPTWVSDYRDTIHKHFEARLILEPEIAALAARRAGPADIDRIRANIELQGSLPESEMAAIIQTDIDFHCCSLKPRRTKPCSCCSIPSPACRFTAGRRRCARKAATRPPYRSTSICCSDWLNTMKTGPGP